jgi:hypothetical protein
MFILVTGQHKEITLVNPNRIEKTGRTCRSMTFFNHMNCVIYNIRTLSVNIKFICTSFRNRQNSEPSASFSGLFRSVYKYILYLTTMYVYCVYPAMSKKSKNLSDLSKKDRNKRHSSPFINVVKGVFSWSALH